MQRLLDLSISSSSQQQPPNKSSLYLGIPNASGGRFLCCMNRFSVRLNCISGASVSLDCFDSQSAHVLQTDHRSWDFFRWAAHSESSSQLSEDVRIFDSARTMSPEHQDIDIPEFNLNSPSRDNSMSTVLRRFLRPSCFWLCSVSVRICVPEAFLWLSRL